MISDRTVVVPRSSVDLRSELRAFSPGWRTTTKEAPWIGADGPPGAARPLCQGLRSLRVEPVDAEPVGAAVLPGSRSRCNYVLRTNGTDGVRSGMSVMTIPIYAMNPVASKITSVVWEA